MVDVKVFTEIRLLVIKNLMITYEYFRMNKNPYPINSFVLTLETTFHRTFQFWFEYICVGVERILTDYDTNRYTKSHNCNRFKFFNPTFSVISMFSYDVKKILLMVGFL